MSVETTHHIERSTAIACIVATLAQATDMELADALYALDKSPFRNYRIVYSLKDEPDWEFNIETINDFLINNYE